MAFYYDQLQMIFDLKEGHSFVLDQKHSEALLVKLATNGFDHTFLLVNNYTLDEKPINLDHFTTDGFNNGDFVVGIVNDTVLNDLAKLLFYHCTETAMNILKNLTNPSPFIATEQECQRMINRLEAATVYAHDIQKRA